MSHGTFSMTNAQQVPVTLVATPSVDPGTVPTWSSSDPSIVTVIPAADGLSSNCVSGNVGSAVVTAVATIGGVSTTGDLDFTITQAADVTLVPGTAVPK